MDPVEEIKARLNIDDVVGGYVHLRQAGRNFKGLCPFHEEKTPSFMVSTEKGIYHCFGCGEGGDMFSFVEKMEGLEFRDTLERLAQQAGVELPEREGDGGKQKHHKQRLREALAAAAQYYHIQLGRSSSAREYVTTRRELTSDTIKKFKVGYAPGGNQRIVQFLKGHGFSEQELIDAGLARRRGHKLQDTFRRRIMVPFFDSTGYIIGFTGRVVDDDSLPKYLNTPQTPLFDKSRFIFGLYQAKESIRSSNEAVIVEGNLDVLRSHQAGASNVVAVSGTALTVQQIKQLSRLASTITLAFDADSAGAGATERALPLAQEAGVDLYIASLPPGTDPDDVIRDDPGEWKRIIDTKSYVMEWLLQLLPAMYDTSTAQGKKELTNRATSVLRRLRDPVEQEHYVRQVADIVGAAPATITKKLHKEETTPKPTTASAQHQRATPEHDEVNTVAEALLSMAMVYPDVRAALAEARIDRLPQHLQTVAAFLQRNEGVIATDNIPGDLQPVENYVKILLLRGEEEYGTWATLDRQIEAFSLVHRLNELQTKRYKQHLSQQIAAAEAAGDYDLRKKLLKEFNQLNA